MATYYHFIIQQHKPVIFLLAITSKTYMYILEIMWLKKNFF